MPIDRIIQSGSGAAIIASKATVRGLRAAGRFRAWVRAGFCGILIHTSTVYVSRAI